jgi:hypothetical protein
VQQLQNNLRSLDPCLAPEHLAALDEASAVELGFPGSVYTRERIVTLVYGGMRDKILTD